MIRDRADMSVASSGAGTRLLPIGPGPVIRSKFQTEKEFLNQCKNMPLKIGSNPKEIAETVIYLLSIPSITGQIITLDGGQHLGWGQVSNTLKLKD